MPVRMTVMTPAPTKPPAAAEPVKASWNTAWITPGSARKLTAMSTMPPTKYKRHIKGTSLLAKLAMRGTPFQVM